MLNSRNPCLTLIRLCALGCSKKTLFSSFGWRLFFLCTNVLKSYQKKFGVIWRSFDPPTRGSYFVWELPLKYKGNSKKIENVLYFLSFLSNSFLFSCFVMATMVDNHISKHFSPNFSFSNFPGGQNWLILAQIANIAPF